MVLAYRLKTGGNLPPIVVRTTGGTALIGGDVVKQNGTTDVYDIVAANGTAGYGWVLNSAAAGEEVQILEGRPGVQVKMNYTGTPGASLIGSYVALAGTTGAQSVKVDEAGNDLFRLISYDTATATCWVEMIPAASQAVSSEG
jgi:hypothetical protein